MPTRLCASMACLLPTILTLVNYRVKSDWPRNTENIPLQPSNWGPTTPSILFNNNHPHSFNSLRVKDHCLLFSQYYLHRIMAVTRPLLATITSRLTISIGTCMLNGGPGQKLLSPCHVKCGVMLSDDGQAELFAIRPTFIYPVIRPRNYWS